MPIPKTSRLCSLLLLASLLLSPVFAACAHRSDSSASDSKITVQGQYDVAFGARKGF